MPARYVLTIMMFLGFVNVYALRINLSMAIVAMANNNKYRLYTELKVVT